MKDRCEKCGLEFGGMTVEAIDEHVRHCIGDPNSTTDRIDVHELDRTDSLPGAKKERRG